MAVGDFARAFSEAIQADGVGPLEQSVSLGWLSGRGHLEPGAADAPGAVRERLGQIHAALGGRSEILEAKRAARTTVDFLLGERTIIELDEIQHFTAERLVSLNHYKGVQTVVDVDVYRSLCVRWRDEAGRAWAKKQAADFPFPGGRRAQRAYLDSVRDLLAPAFGYHLIRVPAPEREVRLAVARLRMVLEAS